MLPGFKTELAGKTALLGAWSTTRDPVIAEKLALTGFDYVCVDQQHGLIGFDSFVATMTALARTGAAPLVRVARNDATEIGRALDAGANGVIVPLVDDAAQAGQAVAACRYAPAGTRSFGPTRSYFGAGTDPYQVNDAVCCLVMIETLRGMQNVREIAGVPGVDGIYVGPADLALSYGHAPGPGAGAGPLADALQQILAACKEHGIAAGIHTSSVKEALRYLEMGFRMVTVVTDIRLLQIAAGEQLKAVREGLGSL
ncbi:HpcH/HpaI aldolase family protein [Amycolatopsis pithecellobii]|uniref:HpcH/HpaI aldolase/citrate lyase domain-containing protein n=1 Tax=Amycolatopsis pithecellobii TaxID=664692 RepID=A0A6N7YMG6_9PSEU|nr:aldolase/citrate lyase family protein [Amycolatopsis pithecellobii]MTD53058.1 hypothetical protein [Amycolatopsis pithecellobii]